MSPTGSGTATGVGMAVKSGVKQDPVTPKVATAVGTSVSITQPAGRRDFRDTTQALIEKSILEGIIAGKDPEKDADWYKDRLDAVYAKEREKHAELTRQEAAVNLELHRRAVTADLARMEANLKTIPGLAPKA